MVITSKHRRHKVMERAMRALMGNNLPPRFKFKDTYDSIEVPTTHQQHLPSQATLEAKFDELIAEEDVVAPTTQINADMVVSSNLEVGTSNLFVDTQTGRVGIGTTTPDLELHVHDANNANSGIVLSSTTGYHRLFEASGQLYFQSGTTASADSRADINFTSMYASTTYMKILGSNGNVGIGTTDPHGQLHIGPKDNNHIYLASSNNSYGWKLDTDDQTNGDVPFRIIKRTGGADTTVLTIKNQDGNVGIGTNPEAKLDVFSSSTDPGAVPTLHVGDGAVDYGDYGMLQLTRHATTGGSKAHAAFIRNGNTVFGMGFHNNTNTFGFWPSFSTVTNTPAMSFTSGGNVGIGATNPGYKLDVSGTGRFTGTVTAPTFSGNAATATTATNQSGGTVNATSYTLTGDDTPHKQSIKNGTNLAVGWYRIAENGNAVDAASNGSRCSARFTIIDYDSSLHSTRTLYAGGTYGNKPFIHLLTNTSHGSDGNISKVRVVEGGTYEGLAVEIYVDTACSTNEIRIVMDDNYQGTGFTMVNFESVVADHSNMNEYELDLNTTFWGMFLDNTTKNICMLENGNVGIGTTNPQTKLSVAGDLTVDGKIYNYNYTEVDINAPATTSGSWSASTSSSWGDPKFNNTYNRRRYNDAPGYVEYTIPTGMKSAYVSQLQWNTGGYVDIHGVQSDGDLVFLRRINTRQAVENSNEGDPGQYDGSTITFAGSSLQHYSKIRLTNKMGRFHMTGLAFTPNENEGTEGTGMVHTAQISDLSGHPVQYVGHNVHSIVSYGSTSGGRYVTPLDVTITPKFSNSKIFVQWVINFEAHQDMVFRVYRGSTLIGYNTSIANNRWNGVSTPDYDQNNSTTPGQSTISWIDSPNTTSAVTYRVYAQSSSTGSYPFYLNRTYAGNNTGQNYHERMVSYKSAMEIAV